MNRVKFTALKNTAITLAGLTAVALLVPAVIFFVPLEYTISAAMIVLLGFAINMIYEVNLAEAEREAEGK